jgi:hypothetical protein
MKKLLIGIFSLAALASSALAAEFSGGESGNWSTATRWGGTEPTDSSLAAIRSGTQIVYVSLADEEAQRIILGQSGSTATLEILSGSLTVSGGTNPNAASIRQSHVAGSTGIVNLSGGSLTTVDGSAGEDGWGDYLMIGDGVSQLNISGGSLSVGDDLQVYGNSVVKVTGNSATINVVDDTDLAATSGFTFDFNSGTAVSLWNTADLLIASGASLDVLGLSSLTAGDYDLFAFSTISGSFDVSDITITGLGGGLSGSILSDGNNVYLNVIPEPSTYALLGGLLALSHVMLRRRRA